MVALSLYLSFNHLSPLCYIFMIFFHLVLVLLLIHTYIHVLCFLYEIKIYVYAFIAYSSAPILRCDNLIHYLALMHRFNDTYFLWGPGSYHLVVVHRPLFNNIRFLLLYNLNFTFFFSSRRRHTRCREVSWARRCV